MRDNETDAQQLYFEKYPLEWVNVGKSSELYFVLLGYTRPIEGRSGHVSGELNVNKTGNKTFRIQLWLNFNDLYVLGSRVITHRWMSCSLHNTGRRSPVVACWASDHWVASSNPLGGKFRH